MGWSVRCDLECVTPITPWVPEGMKAGHHTPKALCFPGADNSLEYGVEFEIALMVFAPVL